MLSANRRTNTDPSAFRSLDWFTLLLYLLLVLAGVVSIYAASYDFDHASIFSFAEFSGKQLRWVGLGLVMGLVILLSDYRIYETYAYPFYVGMMLLLAVTAVIAPDIKGSHSWLKIGPVNLQPAEFAKCATALALAKLFNSYNFKLKTPASYAKAIGLVVLPILLIIAERETGSALVYLSLFFVLYREGMSGMVLLGALAAVVIFVVSVKYPEAMAMTGMQKGEFIVMALIMLTSSLMAGLFARSLEVMRNVGLLFLASIGSMFLLGGLGIELPWKWIFVGEIALGAVYFIFMAVKDHLRKLYVCAIFALGTLLFSFSVNILFDHLAPHQQNRILVSLGIKADPRGAGYNVNQSMIAIGSGGITGKGFLNGTQTKLKYVPEQHTDFIFCTIGEEQGFLGTSSVILLFLMLILRIITIAERQPSTFVRVYAYCVASILIFHFCINLGMVIGLCPVIGIPLPFFSYGGSSLWGFTLLLFILLRLDSARKQFRT